MDALTVQGAMAGIKYAIEAVRTISRTAVKIEIDAKVVDVLDHLGKVQDTLFTLRSALADLQNENLELKAKQRDRDSWDAKSRKYSLVQAPGGAMVYRTKDPPAHYACPKCYGDRKIVFLQDKRVMSGEYACPGCGKHFMVDGPKQAMLQYPPSGGGGQGWMRS